MEALNFRQGHRSSSSSSSSSSTAPIANTVYLSSLTPLQDNENWSGGSAYDGSQQIGSATYADSVRFTCGPQSDPSSLVYDVAGYRFLKATIGVPSDATNASGNSTSVQFLKDGSSIQLGSGITTALDQPRTVTMFLSGASQLEISCTSSNADAAIDIALGNATLVP